LINNTLKKYILYPFALIFGLFAKFRIALYKNNILKGYFFDIPVIKIGNLSLGGSGKSPMVNYINLLLKNYFKTSILLRGYKRKTKGLKFG